MGGLLPHPLALCSLHTGLTVEFKTRSLSPVCGVLSTINTINVYPVYVILSLFVFARGQIPYSTIQK